MKTISKIISTYFSISNLIKRHTTIEIIEMSAKLGFNGELSKEFYNKWHSVAIKRFKFLFTEIMTNIALCFYIFTFFYFDNLFLKLVIVCVLCATIYVIYRNIKIRLEIRKTERNRLEAFYKNKSTK